MKSNFAPWIVVAAWGVSGIFCNHLRADNGLSTAAIRVVNCDQKVQSHKRGICENKMSEEDFRAFAPGVSWYYNWHFKTDDQPPSDVAMEFLPMAWGDRPESLTGLDTYLQSASKKPRVVLAINEPNLKGQSFITPEQTATLYKKVKEIADRYQLAVVGPNMSLGSPGDGSIKAMDPIENKEVTYTFMVPFLKAFFFYMGDTEVSATSFHSYGNIGELKWAVEMMHKEFNRPVWVTEYADWHAGSPQDAREYVIQATDFLERTPYVQGYAWFKERATNNNISLLEKEPGKLTALGQAYVDMPVHDADLYYHIPGTLPAGNYVAMDHMDIMSTTKNALLLSSKGANSIVDYNIQVDVPGTYNLGLKTLGTGKIEVLENDQVLASTDANASEVQTIPLSITLPAGAQTLRVRFSGNGQILSSLELTPHA